MVRVELRSYGPEVNLFVDHTQIVQLECLQSGMWEPHNLFGRMRTFERELQGLFSERSGRVHGMG